jgi:hypothetical protein
MPEKTFIKLEGIKMKRFTTYLFFSLAVFALIFTVVKGPIDITIEDNPQPNSPKLVIEDNPQPNVPTLAIELNPRPNSMKLAIELNPRPNSVMRLAIEDNPQPNSYKKLKI